MNKKNKKVELLAPAGNFEKLEIAVHYGADAVYLAGKNYSLRNFSGNFTHDELARAVNFAHENGVKVYVACNIYSRNSEQESIEKYLQFLGEIKPDAIILADPGIIMEAKNIIPDIPVHLSTQANTTNYKSIMFWKNFGVKRINAARELSLKEIKEFSRVSDMEIEAFVHGAMCISYSGRCLLSSFMTNRDSNLGKCSHPCRWKYHLVEELRPGEYMPLYEDDRGAYIMNSKDLCMIEHIPEMIASNIDSLKIEGRMKGVLYLATTVKTYRDAIDSCHEDPDNFVVKKEWIKNLAGVKNRGYSTGFYLEDYDQTVPDYDKFTSLKENIFLGKILGKKDGKRVEVQVRNKIFKDHSIEVISKTGPVKQDKILAITDNYGENIPFAQPGSIVTLDLIYKYSKNDIIYSHHKQSGCIEHSEV